MRIEILAVGSELLTPEFTDTNSLYLTRRLNDLGWDVARKSIVGDDEDDLAAFLRDAAARVDLLLVMGGLGPTEDDKTREACAAALGRKLVYQEVLYDEIRERFRRRGRDLPPSNAKQAFVLDGAEVLENKNGTAPGLRIREGRCEIVLLPGPPRELEPMFEEAVWPKLCERGEGATGRRVLKITGMGESDVETLIAGLYPPPGGPLRLTILSAPGRIELHATEFSRTKDASGFPALEALSRKLQDRLGDHIYSTSGEELEEVVGRILRERRQTLACAESCTGGLLAGRITNVPGSSAYFGEGFVTYGNEAKIRSLGVPAEWIRAHGAVSAEVATAMAAGARSKASADYGLAVTGIAGPDGGSPEKPVGLVFTALTDADGTETRRNIFFGRREQVRFQSTQKALDMLRRRLLRPGRT
jgi:nicotinamide-nucleotide amidase